MEEHIEVEGRIQTVLAGTMFRVELDNKHQVLATISGKMRKRFVRLTVGDRTLLLPVEMESGSYLELNSPDDCKAFGPDGNLLQEVKLAGEVPALSAGANPLRFACDSEPAVNLRVRVTTFTAGPPLTR